MNTANKLLTPEEVADLLRVPATTIRTWVTRRQIPVIRVGRLLRFSTEDLDRWIALQRMDANDRGDMW